MSLNEIEQQISKPAFKFIAVYRSVKSVNKKKTICIFSINKNMYMISENKS